MNGLDDEADEANIDDDVIFVDGKSFLVSEALVAAPSLESSTGSDSSFDKVISIIGSDVVVVDDGHDRYNCFDVGRLVKLLSGVLFMAREFFGVVTAADGDSFVTSFSGDLLFFEVDWVVKSRFELL